MSDQERGAYTPPTDAPLSFDAREPVRGARPAPVMLIIISILVLVGLAAAIFLFYRSGVRQAGQPPHTVGAPVGEMKAPPPPEAQPQDPAAGLQIYKAEGGNAPPAAAGQPQFTPGPETPQPRPQTAAPVVIIAPSAPAVAPAPAPTLRPAIPAGANTPPAPPMLAAAPVAKPVVVEKAPPAPKPTLAAKPGPAPAKTAPAVGGAVVQIGAVSTTFLADKAWTDAVAVAPGLAAGKGKSVEKIERNGGVLYRTAVTGFASRDAATAFCDK
ncbi:MAG TPA: SPOR domain-containing protein, partial [Phenylobacterium sp.]|nr:SPOR domain-containing protein [Phenylobacterium sp.]